MSNDSETWFKWAYRHYALEVDTYESYDEALMAAWYAASAGTEAWHAIEGPMGAVDSFKITSDLDRLDDEASARAEASYATTPDEWDVVEVLEPHGGDWARVHMTRDEAVALFGALRVKVTHHRKRVAAR